MNGMSDAQFDTLGQCIRRADAGADATAVRYVDTRTVCTLIAMARPARRWVTLEYGVNERGHRCITAGHVTGAGRTAHRDEAARRAAAAARAAHLADVLAVRDPFDLIRRPHEAAIPF